jgi:ribosomal protein S18 acetylase RimI-like enzyme
MKTSGELVQFAIAACDDAALIVDAVREGFSADLLELMIYGSHGICKFVSEQIALQNDGGDIHYTMARCDGRFAGAAEIRRIPEGLFLNYIAIMPAFRDRGFGTMLLREALGRHDSSEQATIVLDVLDHNVAARRWYERLGFREERLTQWWVAPIAQTGHSICASIEGYPQAQACQREYGFSRFKMSVNGTQHEIGRLGEKWYRISDPAIVSEPGLVDHLFRLDARRQLLVLAPDNWTAEGLGGQRAAQTWRLNAQLNLVRENLDRLCDKPSLKDESPSIEQKRISA